MKPDIASLKRRIQSLLAAPDVRPLRISDLITQLKAPPHERAHVRRAVEALLQEGVVVHVRKDHLVLPSQADLVTGRIQMNERGWGFVVPETAAKPAGRPGPDIFVAAEDTGVAMHGDLVVVRLLEASRSERGGQKRGPAGRVIRILERANTTLTGVFQRSRDFHFVVPDDPRIGRDIYVNLARSPVRPKVGDRVVVDLHAWENRHVNPEGKLLEVIGPSDDPRFDIPVIIRKHNLRTDFPPEVLQQADAIPEHVPDAEFHRREDWTGEAVITIDPDDARDHDDALSLKRLPNGRSLVGVHIADVSHYVTPGSALDREARERGNSTYLPDRVIPMLPHRLSGGICSLHEGETRLAFSVFFEIDANGEVHSREFRETVIRPIAGLTYGQALSVLEPGHARSGPPPRPVPEALRPLLLDLGTLAARIRARRFVHGALELDFPEVRVRCDANGAVERIEKVDSDVSHQLVEEFMLLANEAVAAAIRRRELPGIYRIHETPDPEKLEAYRELVIASGFTMGDPTVRGEIQKLLRSVRGKTEEFLLKVNFLRSLKRACYSTEALGHYGLAMENYTHFTSPIRRYADLVVHRILRRTLHNRHHAVSPRGRADGAYDQTTLNDIAAHCSGTERVSDEAEKEATRLKLLEYFEVQMKQQHLDAFDAVVNDVRNFGMFVELPQFLVSGLVHISTIEDDFYVFDAARQSLTGQRRRRVFRPGDRLRVTVARVDRFKKQVDFRLVMEATGGQTTPTRGHRPGRSNRPPNAAAPKAAGPGAQGSRRPRAGRRTRR